MNKRFALATAALAVISAQALGELRVITPSTPVLWQPEGGAFRLVEGPSPAVFTTATFVDRVRLHNFPGSSGHNIKSTTINCAGYVYNGSDYLFPDGSETIDVPRHYPVGSSVDPSGNVRSPVFGWSDPGQDISRTYLATIPQVGGIGHFTLPSEITIGFVCGIQLGGSSHAAWADIRWIAQAGGGYWEVTRWGYETTPNTPARVPPLSGCPSDLNADHDTNVADLSIMLAQFGTSVTPGTGADTNSDGVVNTADLSEMLSWFGCNQID